MLRFVTTRRRLLRKGVYKYNRVRTRQQQFVRENKNLVKTHQNPKKEISATKRRKLRPKEKQIKDLKCLIDINIIVIFLLSMMRKLKRMNYNLSNSSLFIIFFFIVNIYNNACEFIIFFSKVFE